MDDDQIISALERFPHWRREGNQILRPVEAPSFLEGIELVGVVARAAEAANHHPDIDIRWRTVTFRLSTHSAGGVTQKDVDLAGQIDALASSQTA